LTLAGTVLRASHPAAGDRAPLRGLICRNANAALAVDPYFYRAPRFGADLHLPALRPAIDPGPRLAALRSAAACVCGGRGPHFWPPRLPRKADDEVITAV